MTGIRIPVMGLLSRCLPAVALMSLLSAGILFAQGGKAAGGKPQAPPTYATQVAFADRIGDNIMSVGGSMYTDGELNKYGQVAVDAYVGSSFGWAALNTRYCSRSRGQTTCLSLGRYHFFDLSERVTPGPALPTTNGWANDAIAVGAMFEIWPLDADGATKLPNGFRDVMNFPGEQRLAGMKVNFRDASGSGLAGSTFTLRFTPNFYPESNYLLLTYLGGSLSCGGGTTCASWTVEALDGDFDPTPPSCCKVSSLQAIAALPNEDNSINYGTFHVPFRITVTVLPTK